MDDISQVGGFKPFKEVGEVLIHHDESGFETVNRGFDNALA